MLDLTVVGEQLSDGDSECDRRRRPSETKSTLHR